MIYISILIVNTNKIKFYKNIIIKFNNVYIIINFSIMRCLYK